MQALRLIRLTCKESSWANENRPSRYNSRSEGSEESCSLADASASEKLRIPSCDNAVCSTVNMCKYVSGGQGYSAKIRIFWKKQKEAQHWGRSEAKTTHRNRTATHVSILIVYKTQWNWWIWVHRPLNAFQITDMLSITTFSIWSTR